MDIGFGDYVELGGDCYTLLLVDIAKRYFWVYGISYFYSTSIASALETFKADAGHLPRIYHLDFDRKLIGGKSLRWILANYLNIITDPYGQQYYNGLSERTQRTLIQMSRTFIIENQVVR